MAYKVETVLTKVTESELQNKILEIIPIDGSTILGLITLLRDNLVFADEYEIKKILEFLVFVEILTKRPVADDFNYRKTLPCLHANHDLY